MLVLKSLSELKMEQYKEFKNELKSKRDNIRYFNYDFYKTVCRCIVESNYLGVPRYDDVYKTKFYQLNGGAYCEFLNIAYINKQNILKLWS